MVSAEVAAGQEQLAAPLELVKQPTNGIPSAYEPFSAPTRFCKIYLARFQFQYIQIQLHLQYDRLVSISRCFR
jgi:hypothetical protein